MSSPPDRAAETIVFRPAKKRVVYRRRATSASPSDADADANAAGGQSLDELVAWGPVEGPVPMVEILRLRRRRRRGGVEFSSGGEVLVGGGGEGEGEVGAGVRRFAPQVGVGGLGVDRHMMAYIDSALAKRHLESQPQAQPSQHTTQDQTTTAPQPQDLRPQSHQAEKSTQRQPASLGRLQEVDLGSDVRDENVALTERARRIQAGEEIEEEVKKVKKVHLGPDGKPWRGRKRRGSDDVKRDRLVEDVMRENRLEIYESLPSPPPPNLNDDQGAADDRLAESFRREFMDAVSQRQRKSMPAPQPAPRGQGGKKAEEEALKGPKLGGSRNARAAMHKVLLEKQGGKKSA